MSDLDPRVVAVHGEGGARYLRTLRSMTGSRMLLEVVEDIEREARGEPPLRPKRRRRWFRP